MTILNNKTVHRIRELDSQPDAVELTKLPNEEFHQ